MTKEATNDTDFEMTEEEIEKSLTALEDLAKSSGDDEDGTEAAAEESTEAAEGTEETTEEPKADEETEGLEKAGAKKKKMKKAEVEEEDEDEEEEEEEEKSLGGDEFEDPAASPSESLSDDETVEKAIEVSDFLSSIVKGFGKGMDMIDERLERSFSAQNETNGIMVGAVRALRKSFDNLSDRIDSLENAPAGAPKSRRSVVKPVEKSLRSSDGEADGEETVDLRKSILTGLENLVQQGNNEAALAAIRFESDGNIAPDMQKRALAASQ